MKIKINNWSKYQKRNDLKTSSWFALSNRLFADPDFFDFTHAELIFWLYLLSMASQKQSAEVTLNARHAVALARISEQDIHSALEKLQRNQTIELTRTDPVQIRTDSVQIPYENVPYITEQNITIQEDVGDTKRRVLGELCDPAINDVLEKVHVVGQERWLKIYKDPDFIKKILKESISYWDARGGPGGRGWAVVLSQALDRASAPRFLANKTILQGSHNPFSLISNEDAKNE